MIADRAAASGLRIAIDVAGGQRCAATARPSSPSSATSCATPPSTPRRRLLTIAGDSAALTFSDDGPGIPPEVLAHVFDRHRHGHRLDPASASGPRQRGLGLAIARRLCDMQGWPLDARSPLAAGRGTAFTLSFAADAPAA